MTDYDEGRREGSEERQLTREGRQHLRKALLHWGGWCVVQLCSFNSGNSQITRRSRRNYYCNGQLLLK